MASICLATHSSLSPKESSLPSMEQSPRGRQATSLQRYTVVGTQQRRCVGCGVPSCREMNRAVGQWSEPTSTAEHPWGIGALGALGGAPPSGVLKVALSGKEVD